MRATLLVLATLVLLPTTATAQCSGSDISTSSSGESNYHSGQTSFVSNQECLSAPAVGPDSLAFNANATLIVTSPLYIQASIVATNETNPNASPVLDAGYGTPPENCSYSQSSDPSQPCWNPLQINLDLIVSSQICNTPTPITVAQLGGTGFNNILFATNSRDSLVGYGTATATAQCDSQGTMSLTIAVTMDDTSQFTFTGTGPCMFAGPITGTFTSTSIATPGDSGNFTLTVFPAVNGTYVGSFDESGNPSSTGGSGTASITIATNPDFSVSATAQLPAGSLCPAQTSPITLTTSDPLAQINGLGDNIPAAAIGDALYMAMADPAGDVTWMIAGDYDTTTGQYVAADQLYFSTYTVAGICGSSYAWDSVFRKAIGELPSPVRVYVPHRVLLPFDWQHEWDRAREAAPSFRFPRTTP